MTKVLRLFVVVLLVFGLAGVAFAGAVKVRIDLPDIVIAAPPVLAVIPGTDIYIAPDIERDLIYHGGYWYRPHNGRWFKASGYGGPWKEVKGSHIPGPLLRMPADYRALAARQDRMEFKHVKKNWKKWEKDRHWHKVDRNHNGRDDRRERQDRDRDGKDDRLERKDKPNKK